MDKHRRFEMFVASQLSHVKNVRIGPEKGFLLSIVKILAKSIAVLHAILRTKVLHHEQ